MSDQIRDIGHVAGVAGTALDPPLPQQLGEPLKRTEAGVPIEHDTSILSR